MRFLFRWAFRLLILLLVMAIGLFLTKDALAKWWIVSKFREQGMDARIGQLEIGFPLNSTVSAYDVTIWNLPEYGGAPMLEIDDLFIDCDFSELMNVPASSSRISGWCASASPSSTSWKPREDRATSSPCRTPWPSRRPSSRSVSRRSTSPSAT